MGHRGSGCGRRSGVVGNYSGRRDVSPRRETDWECCGKGREGNSEFLSFTRRRVGAAIQCSASRLLRPHHPSAFVAQGSRGSAPDQTVTARRLSRLSRTRTLVHIDHPRRASRAPWCQKPPTQACKTVYPRAMRAYPKSHRPARGLVPPPPSSARDPSSHARHLAAPRQPRRARPAAEATRGARGSSARASPRVATLAPTRAGGAPAAAPYSARESIQSCTGSPDEGFAAASASTHADSLRGQHLPRLLDARARRSASPRRACTRTARRLELVVGLLERGDLLVALG